MAFFFHEYMMTCGIHYVFMNFMKIIHILTLAGAVFDAMVMLHTITPLGMVRHCLCAKVYLS